MSRGGDARHSRCDRQAPINRESAGLGLATAVLYHYANDILPDTIMNMQFAFKVGVVANNENIGIHMDSWDCPE